MLSSKVAKRYAQGLLDFTQESGNTPAVFQEMVDIKKTIENSRDLKSFLNSPIIDYKKKMSVAGEIFQNFSPISKNLIFLVIKHGRESQLQNIAQEYINKVDDNNGVQKITLTTAIALSSQNIEMILRNSGLFKEGNSFDLNTSINPEILGGYILRIGDQQIDASVKTKLNQLRKDFHAN